MKGTSTLRSWHDAGKLSFIAGLSAMGIAAGVASWLLVYGLRRTAGASLPDARALARAMVLGALFSAIVAVVLGAVFDRRPG